MNEKDYLLPQSGNVLVVSGFLDPAQASTELRLSSGQVLHIPTAVLLEERHLDAEHLSDHGEVDAEGGAVTIIPIVEESLSIEKRTVPTGIVRLKKTVQEYQEQLNEILAVRTFDIERIVLNRPVQSAPAVRQEGDTTIYSLVEEQMVLTKQLILKEEVRVTLRETERIDTQVVKLHRDHLVIEREPI